MARICVFGPHPDDQELGMGGTIMRLAEQGHEVLLVDMTNGEPTPLGDPETRKQEAIDALAVLSEGGTPVKRVCLGLPNRTVEHTVEARHLVAGVIRAWQADVLFTTYFQDAHPDHLATTRIVEDARFDSKLSKIEMPPPIDHWTGERFDGPGVVEGGTQTTPCHPTWLFYYYATHLRWVADPNFVFDISGLVERKIRSIEAYRTQFVLPEKNRRVVEWVRSAADYFGSRIATEAGEPMFTKEPLRLRSLHGLLG
ncbi:MAG: PIG-L family deacetylase [Planctomycetota bacterium]